MTQPVRFELELFGGEVERRYRRSRPEVEALPWGTLDLTGIPPEDVLAARQGWTLAAYQEHRTGAACAATLRALIEVQAPVDLIAVATRFPLDEMVHVELCARMAMELGGGTEIVYEPEHMLLESEAGRSALERAADLVVRFFCVGETLSVPLLRGTARAARHPLPRAVLSRIVRDEAAHGAFGAWFLEWAQPQLEPSSLDYLAERANLAIDAIVDNWRSLTRAPRRSPSAGDALAWMNSEAYLALAVRSMRRLVIAPLRARGIGVRSVPDVADLTRG